MKVLHVIPAVAQRYGGPSEVVLEMGAALMRRDVGVLVATTDADGSQRLPVELGAPRCYRGVPAIFFPRQWSEAFKYSRPLAGWLEQHVADFDVVHIHAVFSHACVAAARSCRRRGVPYVVRPLGTLDPWSMRQKPLRKRLLWHLAVKQMLARASAITYSTNDERRLAESSLGLTCGVVIPHGVNQELLVGPTAPEHFRLRQPALGQAPYVLVLCRLHPKKGLELLLDAFLDVTSAKDVRGWRLVVAGDGEADYTASLKRLVQERDGVERVLFTGWLSGREKVTALQGAALLALPSHQENFGLAVAEALACGVPVLISPHVNLAEEVQAVGGGWVVPRERAAVSRALVEALRNRDERARRGAAGRELALARYTWPAVADDLIGLYRSVMTHRFGDRGNPTLST